MDPKVLAFRYLSQALNGKRQVDNLRRMANYQKMDQMYTARCVDHEATRTSPLTARQSASFEFLTHKKSILLQRTRQARSNLDKQNHDGVSTSISCDYRPRTTLLDDS